MIQVLRDKSKSLQRRLISIVTKVDCVVFLCLCGMHEGCFNEARLGNIFSSLFVVFQGSQFVSQVLVHKADALFNLAGLMNSPNPALQKTVMSLLSNMSQTSSLRTTMGR